MPQRYLWAAGLEPGMYAVGDFLLNRYVFRGPQVLLDTQPGYPLASVFDITDDVLPYLKLFSLRLHLPQVYCLLSMEAIEANKSTDVSDVLVLLEGAPLLATDVALPTSAGQVGIAEPFTEAWQSASTLRQVNWLWQMAQLWVPFQREGVAQSLLNPNLLRVEGSLLRMLELVYDPAAVPSLVDLGAFWTKWCVPYVDRWRSKFSELCDRLMEGQIDSIEQLNDELEAWLAALRTNSKVRIDIATRTDSGPTREHNEDACYPFSGTITQNSPEGLAIVCDGVGGHAGGEVASGIAIAALTGHLQQAEVSSLSPESIMTELEVAVSLANDRIAAQNDQENRHDRDRMGTTVVLALAQGHDLYISNIGDSRAYLITPQACYQVTTDDDIGTREVRLGYLPYREAIRQPGSGSLIQALGMVPSSMLRPATQRFVVDTDCVFLLCSDGLSDFERVDSLWQTELRPLLLGEVDLAEASKRLIAAANSLNGHDNVTIALLHYHVADASAPATAQGSSQAWLSPPHASAPSAKRLVVREPKSALKFVGLGMGLLALLAGGVALGLFFWRKPEPLPSPTVSVTSPTPSPTSASLTLGSYWRVKGLSPAPVSSAPASAAKLVLGARAAVDAPSAAVLEPGTLLKLMADLKTPEQTRWLKLQVCAPASSSPSSAAATRSPVAADSTSEPATRPLQAVGYVQVPAFLAVVEPVAISELKGSLSLIEGCQPSTSTSVPSVNPLSESLQDQ